MELPKSQMVGMEGVTPSTSRMNINLHYFELFYYVALYGGVNRAARKMPYGIQPSSLSRQLNRLEREIGVPLYQRRPFALTAAGQKAFDFIKPLMEDLPGLIERLRAGGPDEVRLGASPVVLREYAPAIVRVLQQRFPGLQVSFHEGLQVQLDQWLREKAIDLAVTTIDGDPPEHCLCESLLRFPMVLLVESRSQLRSAAQLWRLPRIDERLIGPPPEDAITRIFRRGLQRRGLEWPLGMKANSIEMLETCVEQGFGIGVSVQIPGRPFRPGLRALPLKGFPEVHIGMIWQRHPHAATQLLMEELRRAAARHFRSNRRVA
jgi:DNA-binding transcriptional LysR family regulator